MCTQKCTHLPANQRIILLFFAYLHGFCTKLFEMCVIFSYFVFVSARMSFFRAEPRCGVVAADW